jgi:hypothetical protein
MTEDYGKQAEELLNGFSRDEVYVIAHADHDGQAAAVALDHLFGPLDTIFHQSVMPPWLDFPPEKRLLIVCDLLLSEKQIGFLLERGVTVLNLDHHDVRDVAHERYWCLNPKKIYGREFISSAGLVWRLFRKKPAMRGLTWILAAGSAVDICVEDSQDLFMETQRLHPELLDSLMPEWVYYSKLFKAGEFMLLSTANTGHSQAVLKKCIQVDSAEPLLGDDALNEKYLEKRDSLERFYANPNTKAKVFRSRVVPLTCIDSTGFSYPGAVATHYSLTEKSPSAYAEYHGGRLFFRNYYGPQDVRTLAALFGGGGAHSRASGAHTSKTFTEVCKAIEEAMSAVRLQKTLF